MPQVKVNIPPDVNRDIKRANAKRILEDKVELSKAGFVLMALKEYLKSL